MAVIFTSLRYLSVYSFEYQIDGNENWVVPPAIDTRIYVDWALENRFQVGDTARDQFKHKEIRDLPLPSISWVFIIFFLRRFQAQEGFRDEGQGRGLQEVQLPSPQLLFQHCLPS